MPKSRRYYSSQCKYCNSLNRLEVETYIAGLNSILVKDVIVMSQRPSTEILEHHNTIEDMIDKGVGAIFNLQQKNEWAFCGHTMHKDCGFSYQYDDFKQHGIEVHYSGWRDNTAPPSAQVMLDIVETIHNYAKEGKKVLVHCHAGKGRTGIVACCYLIYAGAFQNATDAIKHVQNARDVRLNRHMEQIDFIYAFDRFLKNKEVTEIQQPAEDLQGRVVTSRSSKKAEKGNTRRTKKEIRRSKMNMALDQQDGL
ncbi:protein tyrosine phosphatase [Acrasis kona]|uniref:Protein tyrosine phosphatase n=1 Tax=Acrasis kona TaxID=1008807 RepID=A0AAW2ZNN4_9EUKA